MDMELKSKKLSYGNFFCLRFISVHSRLAEAM